MPSDFNDTPLSRVAPLMSSPRLVGVVSVHRPVDDRWTYWWRSRNQATQTGERDPRRR